jgi:hypothetical protein
LTIFGVSPDVLKEAIKGIKRRTKNICLFWLTAVVMLDVVGLLSGWNGRLLTMTSVVVVAVLAAEVGKEIYYNIKNRPQPKEKSMGATAADLAAHACMCGLPTPIDPKAAVPVEEAGAAAQAAAQAIDGEIVEGTAEVAGDVASELVSGIVGSIADS